jgi:hypothetical protein
MVAHGQGWSTRRRIGSSEEEVTGMPARSYEIRIKGRVGEALQAAFADMSVAINPVETVIYGQVRDQAALHGLLDRIQELGLEVLEVRRFPQQEPDGEAGGSHPHPPA